MCNGWGLDHGVSEGTASRRVRWVEDTLVNSGQFALPKRTERFGDEGTTASPRVVVIDVTKTPVERPRKKQRRFYSGKRKRHTLKSEVLLDWPSGRILTTGNAPGRCHDRRLRRQSKSRLPQAVYAVVDLSSQGLQHEHRLTGLPFKATKRHPLDRTKRALNRALARLRITVEHFIRRLKVFWILARPYRNRRRRFGLRLNLIAGLYNFELDHA
jgi:hypothetical protein